MEKPEISVIMSEYNTDPTLLRASIESIINQTFSNFELIIINDASNNDLSKITNEYRDKRIRIYNNKTQNGLVYSLNKALSLSKGKYIARMDTDDYSYAERLEKQYTILENNQNIDILASRADLYDGAKIWGKTKEKGPIGIQELKKGNPICHPSVMMRKKIFNTLRKYPNKKRCEDYALWIEAVINNFKIVILDETLIRYHLNKEDYRKKTLYKRMDYLRLLKQEYLKLKPSRWEILKHYMKTIIAGVIPPVVLYSYHRKKYKE